VKSSGRKLAVASLVVAGATAYMAYLGASSSWQYYMTADECLANVSEVAGRRVRVSGKIAPQTLRIAADRLGATFSLAGSNGQLPVVCSGALPDNLAAAADVVVEGRIDATGLLRGDKVLTRCASKYQSQAGQEGDSPVLVGRRMGQSPASKVNR
jgi:cytochrome c-type biogenesis protein CcmE